MQGIEFETDNTSSSPQKNTSTQKTATLGQWLLKFGLKDTTTANYILLGTAGILLGSTIFIYAGLLGEQKKDMSLDARAVLIMKGNR